MRTKRKKGSYLVCDLRTLLRFLVLSKGQLMDRPQSKQHFCDRSPHLVLGEAKAYGNRRKQVNKVKVSLLLGSAIDFLECMATFWWRRNVMSLLQLRGIEKKLVLLEVEKRVIHTRDSSVALFFA